MLFPADERTAGIAQAMVAEEEAPASAGQLKQALD